VLVAFGVFVLYAAAIMTIRLEDLFQTCSACSGTGKTPLPSDSASAGDGQASITAAKTTVKRAVAMAAVT